MTTRKTTALTVGILLGIAVSVVLVFTVPRPLVLVRLRDDFSTRTLMTFDPREPEPTETSEVVFFPAAEENVVRTAEPDPPPPPKVRPERRPDPRDMPRTRAGAYDSLPPKR